MKTYCVAMRGTYLIDVEVEAESEDAALEIASEHTWFDGTVHVEDGDIRELCSVRFSDDMGRMAPGWGLATIGKVDIMNVMPVD